MKSAVRPWAAWALAAYVLAVVVVLLGPVSPGWVVERLTAWLREDLAWETVRQGWVEFAANVILFVPFGFLVTALVQRLWVGFVAALALSAMAELVQILLPQRTASLRDVLANVAGAAVGAAVAWIVLRARRGRRSPAAN